MESKRFSWLPTKVSSGKWIWFKKYYQTRSLYDENTGRPPLNGLYFIFSETEKERTWRLLKESIRHNRNVWNDPGLTKQDKL